jgi:hypothetical protein
VINTERKELAEGVTYLRDPPEEERELLPEELPPEERPEELPLLPEL